MIYVNNLSVGTRLLPMSFSCSERSFVHVVGPNGSGKSTLLSSLSGMIPFQGQVIAGTVNIAQTEPKDLARYRAYQAQNERPVFAIDVYRYLALSVPPMVAASATLISEAIQYLTHRLDLQDKLAGSIHQVSGGEWQRIRLAGSCLQVWPTVNPDARLLILDEPASALDVGQTCLMYDLLNEIREMGITVIMANHDLNRTFKYATQVLLLNQGVLCYAGEPSVVLNEATIQEIFHTGVQTVEIKGKSYLLFD